MTAWKDHERRTAQILGGTRHVREGFFESAPDVDHPLFAVECKHRERLAVAGWFEQACKYAQAGQIPLLVLHQKGKKRRLAVIDLKDLKGLLKEEGEREMQEVSYIGNGKKALDPNPGPDKTHKVKLSGHEFTIVFDMNALSTLEQAQSQLNSDATSGLAVYSNALLMLWAGTRTHHPDISKEELGSLFMPSYIGEIMTIIDRAVNDAYLKD